MPSFKVALEVFFVSFFLRQYETQVVDLTDSNLPVFAYSFILVGDLFDSNTDPNYLVDVLGVLTGFGNEREIVNEGKCPIQSLQFSFPRLNLSKVDMKASSNSNFEPSYRVRKIMSDTLLIEKSKLASVCQSSSSRNPSVSFLKRYSANLIGKSKLSKDSLDQFTQVSGDKDSCSGDNCLTRSKRSPNDVVDLNADMDAANVSLKFLNTNSIDVASHDSEPKLIHSNDFILTLVGSNACAVVDLSTVDAFSSIKRTIKIEKD
ncbi:hypothetical protein RJT34_12268 [Clitoria ternatea]|uniref:Uncharacterized protein n=1 Tax=Clitoria ternatea TaxID=43366 RepID=A0AAN9JLG8_CLITE